MVGNTYSPGLAEYDPPLSNKLLIVNIELALDGILDYAGLFPPASLSLAAAVEDFYTILDSNEGWITGRMVVPAAKLAEFGAAWREIEEEEKAILCVTASGGDSFAQTLAEDSKLLAESDKYEVATYEIRATTLEELKTNLKLLEKLPGEKFVEISSDSDLTEWLPVLAETEDLYVKTRLGGTMPGSVPSSAFVADWIVSCTQLDLPFKLTAGLHHPFPNRNKETGDHQHGFLNVLAATYLAADHDFSRSEIEKLLDAEPEAMAWDSGGLTWEGQRISALELESARDFFLSFGSCSVAEPIEDLRAYRLIQ